MKFPAETPSPDLQRRNSLLRLSALCAAIALPQLSCGGGSDSPPPPVGGGGGGGGGSGGGGGGGGGGPPPPPPPAGAPRLTVMNTAAAASLSEPWSFDFLPGGRVIVTQRAGQMVVLSADFSSKSNPLAGVPVVLNSGQGGLLDVVVDPDFSTPGSNWVYFSYAESGPGGSGTTVNRGRLDLASGQLLDVSMDPLLRGTKASGTGHYGSRLAFRDDKTLFITFGEKQLGNPSQDLTSTLGKVVRINRDGSIPGNNPTLPAGARPGIWSYGHRNPQGAAVNPATDELWVSEHGPQGGDEINIARAGQNYGWPNVSYGCDYGQSGNCVIGGGTHAPAYTEPVTWWPGPGNATPYYSIAPSGLMFYTGTGFPEWQGNAFLGSMNGPQGRALWRLTLNGNTVVSRERLFASENERIRCVREGPDGWLYFITDSGKLYRVDRA